MNGAITAVITALIIVALLVTAATVYSLVSDPVTHEQLDERLTRIELCLESDTCRS